ncbi:MAG: antibiotic biosynthesis monooxygenase [Streptosporangiaceae bacterium]
MSMHLLAAFAGTVIAAAAGGLLALRCVRKPGIALAAWTVAALALAVALAAQALGYHSGYGSATFRSMEVGAQVIAPLALCFGLAEVAGRTLAARFAARLLLPAMAVVAVVVLGSDPLSGAAFSTAWPAPGTYYQVIPNALVADLLAPVTALVAVIGIGCVTLRARRSPGWRKASASAWAAGLAALLLAGPGLAALLAGHGGIGRSFSSAFMLICLAAAALAGLAGSRLGRVPLSELQDRGASPPAAVSREDTGTWSTRFDQTGDFAGPLLAGRGPSQGGSAGNGMYPDDGSGDLYPDAMYRDDGHGGGPYPDGPYRDDDRGGYSGGHRGQYRDEGDPYQDDRGLYRDQPGPFRDDGGQYRDDRGQYRDDDRGQYRDDGPGPYPGSPYPDDSRGGSYPDLPYRDDPSGGLYPDRHYRGDDPYRRDTSYPEQDWYRPDGRYQDAARPYPPGSGEPDDDGTDPLGGMYAEPVSATYAVVAYAGVASGYAPGAHSRNGHSANGNGHSANGNGHSANGNGHSANGNGHSVNGNGHSANGYALTAPARNGYAGYGQPHNGYARNGYPAGYAEVGPGAAEVAIPEEAGTARERMLGQITIYTLVQERAGEFDWLTERIVDQVRGTEPGTLAYIVHAVPSAPAQRILYEVYRDRAAHELHRRQPHTLAFERDREPLVLATNVIELGLQQAKVAPFPSVDDLFGNDGYDASGFARPGYARGLPPGQARNLPIAGGLGPGDSVPGGGARCA